MIIIIMENVDDGDTNCFWYIWNGPQKIGKATGRVGSRRKNRDHPNYSIVEISPNTKMSPGVVSQTPVKAYQQTLV